LGGLLNKREKSMNYRELLKQYLDGLGSQKINTVAGLFLVGFADWLDQNAAQQGFAADETNRLRELLWVSCLCGACGHTYKYNRADDPQGDKGHEEHLLAYPDCPSSRR
jgi:hypothetical protein